ncbi:unnamed protein product, partial [Discosporangium mesarthrocarpum]
MHEQHTVHCLSMEIFSAWCGNRVSRIKPTICCKVISLLIGLTVIDGEGRGGRLGFVPCGRGHHLGWSTTSTKTFAAVPTARHEGTDGPTRRAGPGSVE